MVQYIGTERIKELVAHVGIGRFIAELARRLGSEQDAQRWQSLCP